jgi:hypothetical protein
MIIPYVLQVTDIFLLKIYRAKQQICLVSVHCVLSGCVTRAFFFFLDTFFFPLSTILITVIIIVVFLAYQLLGGDLLLSPDLDKTSKYFTPALYKCVQLLICVFYSYVDDRAVCIKSN